MSPPLIDIHGLCLKRGERTLCSSLNWSVQPGECWGILGRNGMGKTTLLHTLAGLTSATHGQILLDDKPLHAYTHQQRAIRLGLLLQEFEDSFPGTVLETALIGRHPHLGQWRWETADDYACAERALAQMDLIDLKRREVASLSGGERRRLGIATLLTQAPQIYLLDEPVNHLDPRHQQQILRYFQQLAHQHNKTIIMVLHDVNLVAQYCDHAMLWFDEHEQQTGDSGTLLTDASLSRLYHHPFAQIQSDKVNCFIPLP